MSKKKAYDSRRDDRRHQIESPNFEAKRATKKSAQRRLPQWDVPQ
jgi:hypothetical protein